MRESDQRLSIIAVGVFVILPAMACQVRAQSLNLVSDADGTSTLQSISINAANSRFDQDLTLDASQICGWRATLSNTTGGAVFQIRRGDLQGAESLLSGITVTAEDGGSESAFVPAAGYQSGTPLAHISSSYETLGWVKSNGHARFRLKVSVSSKSKNGSGNVSGTLSIIGALAP